MSHWELFDDGKYQLTSLRVDSLRHVSRQDGISYSVHGPICDLNLATLNNDVSSLVMKRLEHSLRNASNLGATNWVLHPGTHGALSWVKPGEDWKANLSRMRRLKRLGDRLGVEVLVENISASLAVLGRASDFHRLYTEWKSAPDMTFDVGHAWIRGETQEYFKHLSGRVTHVHAHDNDGVVDTHWKVGSGKVDWKWVVRALAESKFEGKVVVESVKGPFASLVGLQKLLGSL